MSVNNISSTVRSAMCDAFVDALDSGAGTAHIRVYTASYVTLLAEFDFPNPAFGAAAAGVATANTIVDEGSAPATGTAAVYRAVDRDGNTHHEGTVSTSGADINFNTVSINTGDPLSITSLTATQPAA